MILFGITTFMFALGIVALVLKTMLDLILFHTSITDALYGIYFDSINYYVWAAITCLMVRLHDAFMPSA
jgi:hypothetical protein